MIRQGKGSQLLSVCLVRRQDVTEAVVNQGQSRKAGDPRVLLVTVALGSGRAARVADYTTRPEVL